MQQFLRSGLIYTTTVKVTMKQLDQLWISFLSYRPSSSLSNRQTSTKECKANIKKLDDEYDKLHEILANASIDGYGEELPNLTHSFSMYGSSGRPFHS